MPVNYIDIKIREKMFRIASHIEKLQSNLFKGESPGSSGESGEKKTSRVGEEEVATEAVEAATEAVVEEGGEVATEAVEEEGGEEQRTSGGNKESPKLKLSKVRLLNNV